jgi:bifunctional enzyme CysN/CysC
MSSPDVVWQDGDLSRAQRWRALDTVGATVWLTGLPASGKSTIGAALEAYIVRAGRFAYLMDGDNLRHGICGDLGFSGEDRLRNIIRAGELAKLFADAGGIAVVALVSPMADARDQVRKLHDDAGLQFLEVFVDTPLEVCAARDPKALYARARAGEITGFTGVDDPYERPARPDLVLPEGVTIPDALEAILELLDGFEPLGSPADQSSRGVGYSPARGQSMAAHAGHPQNGAQR